MKFTVVIAPSAEADLEQAFLWAAARAPERASRWLAKFQQALASLQSLPERCGIAPESSDCDFEVRQLLFGRKPHVWRALYLIVGMEVRVLHIRRAAMQPLDPSELAGP